MANLTKILKGIVRANLLEDRSQYAVEDLQLCYGLDTATATQLRAMIKQEMAK